MAHVLGKDFDRCQAPLADEPTGQDARYEDAFDELKGEIENIASGTVDWENVEKLAVGLLAETSKDLNVFGYLSAALLQRHGFLGLADGFALLRHWAEADWENLHPRKPPRSRGFAFSWLVDRVTPYVESREPKDDAEIAVLEPIRDDLQAVIKIVQENLGHLAPGFGELQNTLRKKAEQYKPSEPEPVEETKAEETKAETEVQTEPAAENPSQAAAQPPRPEAQAPPAAAPPPEPAPTPAAPRPAPVTAGKPVEIPDLPPLSDSAGAREVRDRIRTFIGPLRQSGLLSATPYRMLRVLKWEDLQNPPPPIDPGGSKTRVPAPRKLQSNAIASLFNDRSWPELLEASEAAFQNDNGTFWLDLQRYSALAIENLDPAHGPRLAAIIVGELRELLERFPGLHQLTFADGTPFAKPETKAWIEESVRIVEVEISSGGSRAEDNVLTDEEIAEAQGLFGKKQADAAMDILQSAVERASNPRAVFRTRLTAAQLCLQAGKMAWARTLLDQLREETEGFRFETWEPETAIEVYNFLAICCARQLEAAGTDPDPALETALTEAHNKLFALDLRAAAKVGSILGEQSKAAEAAAGKTRQKSSAEIGNVLKQLLGRL